VDFLKIDGGFMRDIMRDPMDRALVEAINRIDHTVGQETVAEFVEDEATRQEPVGLGVDYAQGYALHRPKPLQACSTAHANAAGGHAGGARPASLTGSMRLWHGVAHGGRSPSIRRRLRGQALKLPEAQHVGFVAGLRLRHGRGIAPEHLV